MTSIAKRRPGQARRRLLGRVWGSDALELPDALVTPEEAIFVDDNERPTIRLVLDGETDVQPWDDSATSAELYLVRDDTSAAQVAQTDNAGFWFLGRAARAQR